MVVIDPSGDFTIHLSDPTIVVKINIRQYWGSSNMDICMYSFGPHSRAHSYDSCVCELLARTFLVLMSFHG